MPVFTVSFCGTGQNYNPAHTDSSKDASNPMSQYQHLVGTLHDMVNAGYKVIYDGVGSQILRPHGIGRTPGQIGSGRISFEAARLAGNIAGRGQREITDQAVSQTLSMIAVHNVAKVNLIGFSRGAVQCMMTASELAMVSPNIEINIFSIDPVSGPNHISESLRVIPASVNKYTIIAMEHDDKGNLFNICLPLGFKTDSSANRRLIPMPGDHGTAADHRFIGTQLHNRTEYPVAFTVLHLGRQLLRSKGSIVGNNPHLDWTESTLADTYAYAKWFQVLKERNQLIPLPGFKYGSAAAMVIDILSTIIDGFVSSITNLPVIEARKVLIQNEEGGVGSPFVNWHHKQCFQRVFPDVYRLLQQEAVVNLQRTPRARSVLDDLYARSPASHWVLAIMGFIYDPVTATPVDTAKAVGQKALQTGKKVLDSLPKLPWKK